jgi:hypothetical protein
VKTPIDLSKKRGKVEAHSTGVNMLIFKGKRIVDLEVDGVDSKDYPDFSDAYFSYACYEDGTELTDEELNELTDSHGDIVNQMAFDSSH